MTTLKPVPAHPGRATPPNQALPTLEDGKLLPGHAVCIDALRRLLGLHKVHVADEAPARAGADDQVKRAAPGGKEVAAIIRVAWGAGAQGAGGGRVPGPGLPVLSPLHLHRGNENTRVKPLPVILYSWERTMHGQLLPRQQEYQDSAFTAPDGPPTTSTTTHH